jgi:hypothetical protein
LCGEPKQQAERAEFMDLVMEDAKFFKFTSIKAREERERLQGIHHKVHEKARASRFDPKSSQESMRLPKSTKKHNKIHMKVFPKPRKEGSIAYKDTSHPSNIKKLTPYRLQIHLK